MGLAIFAVKKFSSAMRPIRYSRGLINKKKNTYKIKKMNNLRTNQRETSQDVSNSVERDIASESSSFNSAGANRDRMSNMIESIIRREIQGGCVFDAHAIIEYIIQHDRDLYVQTNVRQWTTEFYHSDISKKIARFEDSLIESLGNSWSLNIRKRFSNNKCWRKLT